MTAGYLSIRWVQHFRHPVLDGLFLFATALNSREFYVPALGLLYWCVDRGLAFRLTNLLLTTLWVNSALKHALGLPRPDPRLVDVLVAESTPGMPSGHAQAATVFWGYLAGVAGTPAARWAAAAMIATISLSRIYLGVHFPLDLAAGWLLGFLWLAIGFRLPAAARRWALAWPGLTGIAAAVAIPAAAGLAMALLHRTPDAAPYTGGLVGAAAGHALGTRYVPFRPRAPLGVQVAKVALGVALLSLLRVGAKALLPPGFWPDVLRYLLIGLVATGALPWLFVRLSLEGKEDR